MQETGLVAMVACWHPGTFDLAHPKRNPETPSQQLLRVVKTKLILEGQRSLR